MTLSDTESSLLYGGSSRGTAYIILSGAINREVSSKDAVLQGRHRDLLTRHREHGSYRDSADLPEIARHPPVGGGGTRESALPVTSGAADHDGQNTQQQVDPHDNA